MFGPGVQTKGGKEKKVGSGTGVIANFGAGKRTGKRLPFLHSEHIDSC